MIKTKNATNNPEREVEDKKGHDLLLSFLFVCLCVCLSVSSGSKQQQQQHAEFTDYEPPPDKNEEFRHGKEVGYDLVRKELSVSLQASYPMVSVAVGQPWCDEDEKEDDDDEEEQRK